MYKKRHFYWVTLLFMFLWWSATAEAYQVNNYWTSAEGWGVQTTNFTTTTDSVFINVEASHIPEPITNLWMRMEWYQPGLNLVEKDFLSVTPDELVTARTRSKFCQACKAHGIHRAYCVYGDEKLIEQKKSLGDRL